MKRTQRVIMSLLLVLALVGVPVSQVMAASYDATEDWNSQDLYPGDDLTGIEEGVSVTQDGEDVPVSDGTWTNASDDLVYQAIKADGAIALTAAGYSLTVVGGSSHGEDGAAATCYESGTSVTIVADEPEEGSVFTGWTCDSEGLIADSSSATTTFTMPSKAVTVKAHFSETVASDESAEGEEAAPAEGEEAASAEGEEAAAPAEGEEAAPAENAEAVPEEYAEAAPEEAWEESADAEIIPVDAGEAENPDAEWAEPAEEAGAEEWAEPAEEADAEEWEEPAEEADAEEWEEPAEEADANEWEEPAEEADAEEGAEPETEADILMLEAGAKDADVENEEDAETEETETETGIMPLANESEETDEEETKESEEELITPEIIAGDEKYIDELGEAVLSDDGLYWVFTAKAKNPKAKGEEYQFAGWSAVYEDEDGEDKILDLVGDVYAEDTELTFLVETGAKKVKVYAVYDKLYEVRVEGGEIESGDYWYLPGDEVKIKIIAAVEKGGVFDYWDLVTDPDLGEAFQPLKFDCDSEVTELEFFMPEATVILSANIDYEDNDGGSGSGSGSGSGTGSGTTGSTGSGTTTHTATTAYKVTVENGKTAYAEYYPGETVTITADYPTTNQEFNSWSLLEGKTELADPYRSETTFTMPEEDVTVSATYKDGPSYWIEGITEGATYASEERLTFTPVGGGMDNTDPNPGDIRYVPTSYTIGNVSNTWTEAPYTTSMSIRNAGEYTLTVSFTKQLWNGSEWEDDGTTALATVTFYISANGTTVSSSGSGSSGSGTGTYGSVNTGDTTPVLTIALIALAACLVFIILLIVFIRRRKGGNKE